MLNEAQKKVLIDARDAIEKAGDEFFSFEHFGVVLLDRNAKDKKCVGGWICYLNWDEWHQSTHLVADTYASHLTGLPSIAWYPSSYVKYTAGLIAGELYTLSTAADGVLYINKILEYCDDNERFESDKDVIGAAWIDVVNQIAARVSANE